MPESATADDTPRAVAGLALAAKSERCAVLRGTTWVAAHPTNPANPTNPTNPTSAPVATVPKPTTTAVLPHRTADVSSEPPCAVFAPLDPSFLRFGERVAAAGC
ncbi:MAG: hypothetical protein ACKO3W_11085, partial [bacterium]